MRAVPRSVALELAIPFALALTLVAFACGSSSIPRVTSAGHGARWAMLVATGLLALLACRTEGRWPRPGTWSAAWALLAVGFLSAAWSVDPRLTIERAGSLLLLFGTAALVCTACRTEWIFAGLLGGAVAVGLLSLLVLAVDHKAAVQPGSTGVPPRFRGLGQSANTTSLLFGVALPLTVWLVVAHRDLRSRALGVASFVLLDGSIVASGSRGALLGGFVGGAVLAVALAGMRARVATLAVLAALFAASFVIGTLPQPLKHGHPRAAHLTPPSHPNPGYLDANVAYPLYDDIGRPLPGGGESFGQREALGSSGRTAAWRGALHQAAQRPVAGYGFGTEDKVFVNRYHLFAGGVPENSYVGIVLQLGAVGLLVFLGLFGWWLWRGARALGRSADRIAIAAAGAVAVGALASAVVQSYVLSVGDIATATFWIAAFLVADRSSRQLG